MLFTYEVNMSKIGKSSNIEIVENQNSYLRTLSLQAYIT